MIDITDAIISLRPKSAWSLSGTEYEGLTWLDQTTEKPTKQELIDEINRLQEQYDYNLYQRQRVAEYPSYGEQFDIIFHEGYDVWKEKIQDIKDKYPKPENI